MDGAIFEQQDGISDYGSEFTPDEEEILNGLLQQVPAELVTDSDLLLKDIEDNEGPRGARVPRTQWHERRNLSLRSQAVEKGLSVEVEWNNSSITNCRLIVSFHGNTN